MHQWGDEGIDWKGIGDAADWIGSNLRRWGRVSVSCTKEKYGTARVYCSFGYYELIHGMGWPGYHYYRYPKWLMHLDHFLSFKLRLNWLVNKIMVPYQTRLYTYLYGRALRRWPHLRLEILCGADYSELLGKYGVHSVRTSENGYTIYHDWHPDNWVPPKEEADDSTEDPVTLPN